MSRQNEATFLRGVLRNNEAAAQFCEMLFRISQTLDDLIDKDNPVSDATLIRTFWEALIELPANPFYRQHEPYLRPLMASALQDWRDSACLERSDSHHYKTLAFVLRVHGRVPRPVRGQLVIRGHLLDELVLRLVERAHGLLFARLFDAVLGHGTTTGAIELRTLPIRRASIPLPLAWGSDLQLSAAAASSTRVTPKPKKLITFDRISPPNQFRQIDEILRCSMLGLASWLA